MGEPVSSSVVGAFYEALASRDPIRLSKHLADDVEWFMAGPVHLFSFCGYRRGKAAVVDYIGRAMPSVLTVKRYEPLDMLIDGDTAAFINDITAVQNDTGRVLTYQTAIFAVFRDGKVAVLKGVADTFDIAEQVVGHRIDAYGDPDHPTSEDVVAL
jgi:ketosteroid isomerase-like protein